MFVYNTPLSIDLQKVVLIYSKLYSLAVPVFLSFYPCFCVALGSLGFSLILGNYRAVSVSFDGD